MEEEGCSLTWCLFSNLELGQRHKSLHRFSKIVSLEVSLQEDSFKTVKHTAEYNDQILVLILVLILPLRP